MLHKKSGFTLVELLVAAVIIGVLVVFASQSFRHSSSDIRVQNALAKAKVVAMAARMFKEDHANASFTSDPLQNPLYENIGSEACDTTGTVTLQTLISCGYLEDLGYVDKDFAYNFDTCAGGLCVCISKGEKSRVIATTSDARYCTDGETVEGAGF